MKRCLTCQRVYADESLKFCRDDGEPLVVAALADESAGAVRLGASSLPASARDAPTRVFGVGEAAHLTVPPAKVETSRLEGPRPEGVIRRALRSRRRVLTALLAAPVLAGASLAFYSYSRDAGVAVESIAVLPFTSENRDEMLPRDLSEDSEGQRHVRRQVARDKELEKISNDLTKYFHNNLPPLPRLRIATGDSAARYRGGKDARIKVTAGREMGVHAVFSGHVEQVGDRLTISVELVDARHDEHIWGDNYDCKVEELEARRRDTLHKLAECLRQNQRGKRCEN